MENQLLYYGIAENTSWADSKSAALEAANTGLEKMIAKVNEELKGLPIRM